MTRHIQRNKLGVSIAAVIAAGVISFNASADRQSIKVDLKQQRVDAALMALAENAGIQIVFPEGIGKTVQSSAIKGEYQLNDALSLLLAGTGLVYQFASDDMIVIKEGGEEQSESQGEPDEVEEIVVTGTRLKGHNPASPVITLDRQKLERGGYSSLEDVFRRLPQNLSSITSQGVDLGQTEFGDFYGPDSPVGASSINLRGLGSRATLVLINGRRKASSAQTAGGFIDVSSIPLSQVERIEILTDGASAIYGADAVAGVVNIVLRKDYEGAVVQVHHENSHAGADVSRVTGAYTFHWDSGFLTASAEASESKASDINGFIHVGPSGVGDFSDIGGVNARRRGIGQPGAVYEAVPYVWDPFSPNKGDLIGLIPGGHNGQNLMESDLVSGDPDTRSVYERRSVGPKIETQYLRLNGEQAIGNDLNLSFDLGYTQQQNEKYWEPEVFWFNFLGSNRLTYVPETNPNNNFGRDVLVGYSYANEFSQMTLSNEQEQDNYQASIGLDGTLPFADGWDFTLDYSYSKERGQSVDVYDITGTTGSGDNAPELRVLPVINQLNVFSDGGDPDIIANNILLLNSLVERHPTNFESDSHSFEATVSGELFSLPGGVASAVAGFQLRQEKNFRDLNYETIPATIFERDVKAWFGEMRLPLLSDLPGIEELVMTVAVRHENIEQQGQSTYNNNAYSFNIDKYYAGAEYPDYYDVITTPGVDLEGLLGVPVGSPFADLPPPTTLSRSFSSTDPQVTLSWKPISDLRLRATWGESFLTPQPQQQFGVSRSFDGTFSYEYDGAVLPEGVDTVVWLSGPNPDLQPQNAETLTYGFDYTPSMLSGLEVGVTYNRTEFTNYIGSPTASSSVSFLAEHIDTLPEVFRFANNGVMVLDTREVNFSGRKSETIDIRGSYSLETDFGRWELIVNAVRNLELSHQVFDQAPKFEFADTEYGVSRWAGNATLNWDYGNYSITAVAHHTSEHKVVDPLSASGTIYNDFMPNPSPRRNSASYTTVDLQVGYRSPVTSGLMSGVKFQLGAQNLFNPDFPFVDNTIGFLSNRVSSRGRVIYMDIVKEFDL